MAVFGFSFAVVIRWRLPETLDQPAQDDVAVVGPARLRRVPAASRLSVVPGDPAAGYGGLFAWISGSSFACRTLRPVRACVRAHLRRHHARISLRHADCGEGGRPSRELTDHRVGRCRTCGRRLDDADRGRRGICGRRSDRACRCPLSRRIGTFVPAVDRGRSRRFRIARARRLRCLALCSRSWRQRSGLRSVTRWRQRATTGRVHRVLGSVHGAGARDLRIGIQRGMAKQDRGCSSPAPNARYAQVARP